MRQKKTTEAVDVAALVRSTRNAKRTAAHASALVNALPIPIIALDEKLVVTSANRAYYETYATTPRNTLRRSLFEIGRGLWNHPSLREACARLVEGESGEQRLDLESSVPGLGPRLVAVTGRRAASLRGARLFMLHLNDVTAERRGEVDRDRMFALAWQAQTEAEAANRSKDRFLATLSHDLRTPLSVLLVQARLLRIAGGDAAKIARACDLIARAVQLQAQLIDDLSDISRLVSGKAARARSTPELPPALGKDQPGPNRPIAASSLEGLKVLLVDDDADSREALALLLAGRGAEVSEAGSAAEGLAAVEAERPHFLVSDLAMPGEDGFALIRKVRALAPERGGRVPALALTGRVNSEDRRRALAAGYQAHVAKPVDIEQLAEVILRTLER